MENIDIKKGGIEEMIKAFREDHQNEELKEGGGGKGWGNASESERKEILSKLGYSEPNYPKNVEDLGSSEEAIRSFAEKGQKIDRGVEAEKVRKDFLFGIKDVPAKQGTILR